MKNIKELFDKYREIIIYIIVGVLTTIVAWVACFIAKFFLNTDIAWQNSLVNLIGWVAGVCFSFPLNKKWVFKSTDPKWIKEFAEFTTSRISTGVLEILVMDLFVNVIKSRYWIAKILIAAPVVTILNYVLSKLWVFKKKKAD